MCSVSDKARMNNEYSCDDEYQLGSDVVGSDLSLESIKIGDTINYWLSISIWGEASTMRYGKVVKVVSANEIYQPHLYLDNGDTVHWGDAIRKVKETINDDGITKQFIEGQWRSSNLYDYVPSEDKVAYRKSLTRDSNTFKSIQASACRIFEDTGFVGNKTSKSTLASNESSDSDYVPSEDEISYRKSLTRDSNMWKSIQASARRNFEETGFLGDKNRKSTLERNESSDSDYASSEDEITYRKSSHSDETTELGDNTTKDNNGSILGPKCSQQCFIGHIKCHHEKQKVSINTPGDYVGFDATMWHHGFFIHVMECTYYTAQLFCVPSHQMQSSTRAQQRTTRLDNYIVGHLDESVFSGLTRDLVSKWDDNDNHGYSADKYPQLISPKTDTLDMNKLPNYHNYSG
jgi:hypothetical protein